MAKCSNSVFSPGDTPSKRTSPRFDLLAKSLGWTEEQLRKCSEQPSKRTGPVVRMPPDLLLDPFKNTPHSDGETEYNELETAFYNKLSKLAMADQSVAITRRQKSTTAKQGGTMRKTTDHASVAKPSMMKPPNK